MIYKFICIVCMSSLPYLFSLRGDFVFDDSEAIVKNKDVFNSSWSDAFSNDFWGTSISSNLSHKSYRPVTILSYKFNYLQSGQQLIANHFKITNLVCHLFCTILVWLTCLKIFKSNNEIFWLDEAFLSALLFSVHPIHVEAISGIVGRADILAGITFFLAFLAYEKAVTFATRQKWLYLITAVLLSGISMLCKENGVTVLGFCIIYEFITKFKMKAMSEKPAPRLKVDSIIRVCTVMTAALCLLYGRWTVMGGTKPEFQPIDNPAAFANSTFTRIATFNYIYFLNALLLIWPQWLCYDWSMGCVPLIDTFYDLRIVPVVLIHLYGIFLLNFLVNNRNKHEAKRHIILASSLIVMPFLPAANIFYPVGFVVAERILYTSSAGYCALIAIGVTKIMRKTYSKYSLFLYSLLLLAYGLRSWERSSEWETEYLLFNSGLSVCPLNAKVHYNIAKVADAKQNTELALKEYGTAIRLYPKYYQAMNNLANLLKDSKQFEEAEFHLRKAISYKQDFPAAWMNLGIVLANTKRYKESREAYNMALKYRRNYADCYYNLGNLHLEMNENRAAIASWLEALEMNPKHNQAWTNLIVLMDNMGELEKEIDGLMKRALKELHDSPSVNFAVANGLGKLGRFEESQQHFLKAIELYSDGVKAIHYANLGVLYHRWNKYSLAKEMYEKALLIDPNFKSASTNLRSLLKHLKNK